MKIQIFAISALLMCSAALQAQVAGGVPTAQGKGDYHLGFRIAPRISTLGYGLEAAKGFTPNFGMRMGFNYFTYGYNDTESGTSYNLDLGLKSFAVIADWHPFKGSFRLSGGLLLNGNKLELTGSNLGSVDLDGTTYSLDSLTGDVSYNAIAPYFGLGWDTTFGDHEHWGFTFDLGLVYTGSPKVGLNAQMPGPPASFASDLERERSTLEGELDMLTWWPVLSTGIVYQF